MQQVESQSIPIVNSIPRPTLLSHTQTINQPTKHPPAPPFTPSVQARPQLRNRNLRLPASFPAPARWPGTNQAPSPPAPGPPTSRSPPLPTNPPSVTGTVTLDCGSLLPLSRRQPAGPAPLKPHPHSRRRQRIHKITPHPPPILPPPPSTPASQATSSRKSPPANPSAPSSATTASTTPPASTSSRSSSW